MMKVSLNTLRLVQQFGPALVDGTLADNKASLTDLYKLTGSQKDQITDFIHYLSHFLSDAALFKLVDKLLVIEAETQGNQLLRTSTLAKYLLVYEARRLGMGRDVVNHLRSDNPTPLFSTVLPSALIRHYRMKVIPSLRVIEAASMAIHPDITTTEHVIFNVLQTLLMQDINALPDDTEVQQLIFKLTALLKGGSQEVSEMRKRIYASIDNTALPEINEEVSVSEFTQTKLRIVTFSLLNLEHRSDFDALAAQFLPLFIASDTPETLQGVLNKLTEATESPMSKFAKWSADSWEKLTFFPTPISQPDHFRQLSGSPAQGTIVSDRAMVHSTLLHITDLVNLGICITKKNVDTSWWYMFSEYPGSKEFAQFKSIIESTKQTCKADIQSNSQINYSAVCRGLIDSLLKLKAAFPENETFDALQKNIAAAITTVKICLGRISENSSLANCNSNEKPDQKPSVPCSTAAGGKS